MAGKVTGACAWGSAARLALLTWLALTGGCSWIFVQALPKDHSPRDYPDCTDNYAAPVIDTIFTLTNLASIIWVAGQDDVANKPQAIGLAVPITLMWGSSAAYGYSKVGACVEAKGGNRPPSRARPVVRHPPPPPRPRPVTPPPDAPTPAPADADSGTTGGTPEPSVVPEPGKPGVPQQADPDDPSSAPPRPKLRLQKPTQPLD